MSEITGLTVGQLHKILGKMIEEGHTRKPVSVNKGTFTHALEGDGATILRAYTCEIESIPLIDDDGNIEMRADGTESCKLVAILEGYGPLEDEEPLEDES